MTDFAVLDTILTGSSFGVAAGIWLLQRSRRYAKYVAIVVKAYRVLDPILCAYAGKIDSDEMVALSVNAIKRLQGGQISEQDLERVVKLFWALFDLRKATQTGQGQILNPTLSPQQHLDAAIAFTTATPPTQLNIWE